MLFKTKETIGETRTSVIYLKECPQGSMCSTLDIELYSDASSIKYCAPYTTLIKENEECVYDFECETQKCSTEKKCEGLSVGTTCDKDYQCTKGTFCNKDNQCQKLFKW